MKKILKKTTLKIPKISKIKYKTRFKSSIEKRNR